MNISLTADLEKFVQQKVASGLYTSASEVVREGLRLLAEREEYKEARLADLRREIDLGLADARAGLFRDGETVMAELSQKPPRRRKRRP
jgi:antitoxin ParD1/3/4